MTSHNFGHFLTPLHRHVFYYCGLNTVVTKCMTRGTPSPLRPWSQLWTTPYGKAFVFVVFSQHLIEERLFIFIERTLTIFLSLYSWSFLKEY
jgi:hypothetical protein